MLLRARRHQATKYKALMDGLYSKSASQFAIKGKRKGPRIIYYCDSHLVVGMFLYTKKEQDDVPVKEINKALEETGLPD